ncbi:MAG: radical SAM family heme chaperone HemW [Bacteroidales bacterium]|nr:radical SAM family heme chaperone HemW [Bacteroidales bacterium]
MAGIYIHIPFCKTKCNYCDFYRITDIARIPVYLKALEKEIEIRKEYLEGDEIESIYIGGGTPSLLGMDQINSLLYAVDKTHNIIRNCEITFEANPDDLSASFLGRLKYHTPINRLSIGIQSFFDADLTLLNRRHRALQSVECLEQAANAGFRNINMDLIYGIPGMTAERWEANLQQIPYDKISHLSAYHLTVEPDTPLHRMVETGHIRPVDEETSRVQYILLCRETGKQQFQHYEISNFCRDGFYSIHNSGYWKGRKYLGLGASAHSYDLNSRQWNVSDVKVYIKAVQDGGAAFKYERINDTMRFNEYVMVSLRTIWGVSLKKINSVFGSEIVAEFIKNASRFLDAGQMICIDGIYTIPEASWLISDYIVSSLMLMPKHNK